MEKLIKKNKMSDKKEDVSQIAADRVDAYNKRTHV